MGKKLGIKDNPHRDRVFKLHSKVKELQKSKMSGLGLWHSLDKVCDDLLEIAVKLTIEDLEDNAK